VRRLLLVRHASTPATRARAFPADEALDERGRTEATALGAALAPRLQGAIPPLFDVLCSSARRCIQTAEAAGLQVSRIEPELAECDFGAWAGRTLAEVSTADAEAAAAWMADPAAQPHGGESLIALAARIAAWLDRQAALDGDAVAITHGGVVRAALVHALGAPLDAFWRIDVAPLAITELHAHDGRWTVKQVNAAGPTIPKSQTAANLLGAHA